MYQRVGKKAMSADDFYLLGVAMARAGDYDGSLKVLEEAYAAQPLHAETLYMLTQAYSGSAELSKAIESGHRLASCSGWECHAEVLLGMILYTGDDPSGAITHWQRALEHKASVHRGFPAPIVPRKELARALLQTGRPAEAQRQLEIILAEGPDSEASWLLSRAYLQQGARAEALGAWGKGRRFREQNALVPEPAPVIGSAACATCHPNTFQAQQGTRHARTFYPVAELRDLDLPTPSFPDPAQPAVTHTLDRSRGGLLRYETHVNGRVFRAVAEYALGSGHRGLTFIGHDDQGQPRKLRLSHYASASGSCWDISFAQPKQPSDAAQYLGEPMTEDSVRRCYRCHVTEARAVQEASSPLASDRGIGCEKCHGPGGNHALAVRARFPDLAIASPASESGSRVVDLCAKCHTPDDRPVLLDDPKSVRFQGTTLTWSRCFTQSNDALDCVTCHDPHQDAVTLPAHYEAKCLSCHRGSVRSESSPIRPHRAGASETTNLAPCPVNPKTGCITCHMPKVNNVVPHSSFTDHFIRVHRD
jgi:tetratricopeptide (TPR) repeat protein